MYIYIRSDMGSFLYVHSARSESFWVLKCRRWGSVCVKGGVVLCAVVLCLSVSVVCVCAQVYQLSEFSSLAARGAQPAQPVGVWVEFLEGHAKFAGNQGAAVR